MTTALTLLEFALWGAFGGVAVEAIEILGAVKRTKKLPWKVKGEVSASALTFTMIVRIGLGSGLAVALGQAGQIAGGIGAVAAGVAAPLILEQMSKQLPGQDSPPPAPEMPQLPAPEMPSLDHGGPSPNALRAAQAEAMFIYYEVHRMSRGAASNADLATYGAVIRVIEERLLAHETDHRDRNRSTSQLNVDVDDDTTHVRSNGPGRDSRTFGPPGRSVASGPSFGQMLLHGFARSTPAFGGCVRIDG